MKTENYSEETIERYTRDLETLLKRGAILEELRGIAEVQEAFFSYGVYDLIVKIRTDSMEELKELVSHRLRILPNVKSTVTLIKVEERKITVTI